MTKNDLLGQFKDTRSAADFLGVSPQTLYEWMRQDPLPRRCQDRAIAARLQAGLSVPPSWLRKARKTAEA